ncbi:MAG: type IV pilin protein [Stenotrophobium sp.]
MTMHRASLPQAGFTLIELMITIVIVSILAAISIPAYTSYVQRSRRSEAQVAILGLAQTLERYFTSNNSYTGAALPALFPVNVPATGTADYTLSLSVSSAGDDYTISAVPAAGGPQANDKCGTFTYTASGAEAITGQASGVVAADCWK